MTAVTEIGDLKYQIDPTASVSRRRSLEVMLLERRCYLCQSRYEEAEELPSAEEHLRAMAECCAQQPGFIVPEMPMLEIVFRSLIQRGNEPTSLQALHDTLTDDFATPLNPRAISLDVLHRIIAIDDFYGFTELAPDANEG